ncbi:nucleoside triphosphate pyrophosphohydrolase [Neiella marina]|uniref:Nucleoside triphosphate pyrophosphohydrolase n=1 Tax=Neiella holothuriorum TaxID=2870530 RepID=A0ABS7EBB6_9GAMM|nr:nucleoside triphosphate pyrophosphohydrolase [Neiella holothuriorum]MBW8189586.1 nucleoside triphosphate pyrophosphohydrolase [Neiella holothuriorum]
MSQPSSIQQLLDIMAKLRDPNGGCPWDIKQDFDSIVPYTIEEAYEVADAIEQRDFDELRLELGDLLLQVVFHAQMAKEQQLFDFNDVVAGINEKLIRRHPHVFGAKEFADEAAVHANWEAEKQKERAAKGGNDQQEKLLDSVTLGLPALSRAHKLQKKASKVGFDWPTPEPVFEKIKEEVDEVADELAATPIDQSKLEAEIGDLLFAVVNLARHHQIDPEHALRVSNRSFEQRFGFIEQTLTAEGRSFEDSSLAEMDALWREAKRHFKNK